MTTSLRRGRLFRDLYEPQRLLGAGGMGQAFLGRNVQTEAAVVIKVMHSHLAQDATQRRRFAHEIDMLGRARHANVVALLDSDAEAAEPFLIQEYVEGVSLDNLLQQGKLPLSRVATLLGQLCATIHALHARGILHRDLTAGNIMIVATEGRERIKLMDFGLATLGASGGLYLSLEKLTADQKALGGGTPDYLCPEQIRKQPVDQRGDLYSLGVLLYYMLSGKLPFAGVEDVADILLAHVHTPPPHFSAIGVHHIPAAVEKTVHRLLEKDPAATRQRA